MAVRAREQVELVLGLWGGNVGLIELEGEVEMEQGEVEDGGEQDKGEQACSNMF